MITFPNAKINIGLNVVSKREDGYHNLETIFYPVKLSDALEAVESETTNLSVSGIHIDGNAENNLVLKAYRILQQKYGLPPVQFHLHKKIPIGAGLGGGSSNAAFALKLLNDYFKLNISDAELEQIAVQIGADCAFFIKNNPSFATGTGDSLEQIKLNLTDFQILIVKPDVFVSTGDAYKNVIPSKPAFSLKNINSIKIEEWKDVVKNDFENSIFRRFPEIETIKDQLYEMGAVYASMSGSGSSVFGIFRHLPVNPEKFLPKRVFIYR